MYFPQEFSYWLSILNSKTVFNVSVYVHVPTKKHMCGIIYFDILLNITHNYRLLSDDAA